jgi:hypothetical protein
MKIGNTYRGARPSDYMKMCAEIIERMTGDATQFFYRDNYWTLHRWTGTEWVQVDI